MATYRKFLHSAGPEHRAQAGATQGLLAELERRPQR